jgi:hypothetical protein
VSADTTTISSNVETINVDDEEGDVQLPKATTALSLGEQAGGDAPPDFEDVGAIYIEHQPSGRRWVEQENEEGPTQALQARP